MLTGGRAPVTLDLARKFTTCGYDVYVADSIKHHLCYFSNIVKKSFLLPSPAEDKHRYIDILMTILKENKIDALIPTCEEVFYISEALKQLSSIVYVMTDNIEKLNSLHNKYEFNQLIKNDSLINSPKTQLITSMQEYEELQINHAIGYPHVLKPAYSRFASKVRILFEPENVDIAISKTHPWVVQEYVSGKMFCTYTVCYEGEVLANTFYQNPYTAGQYGAGIYFEKIYNSALLTWIKSFVKNINYTGQIAFDVIQKEDGSLWPIECNPRATSGIHLFNHPEQLCDALLGRNTPYIDLEKTKSPMLMLAMLLYGFSIKKFMVFLKDMLKGKDIIFCWRDPLPFLTQFSSVIQFLKVKKEKQISLLEATTHDIEWNGL